MKLRVIVFCCVMLGTNLSGFANEVEEGVQSHVVARMSDIARSDGFRTLFVYSKAPLMSVRYRQAEQEKWLGMNYSQHKFGYYIYATPTQQPAEAGTSFQISGVNEKLLQVTDQLTVQDAPAVEVSGLSEAQLTNAPALDQSTVHYGSPVVHPQILAQARANEMARLQSMTHFGGGIVRTTIGTLAEGIGCGGPNCGTCTATNGTAAVGDGQAVSANGMTYRCRLYNSPGTAGGGGGGRGRGRRR